MKGRSVFVLFATIFVASCHAKTLGGQSEKSPTDQGVQDAAKFAIEQLNAQSNSMYRVMIRKIISVQKQVVAGQKYTIRFEIAKSTCRNSDENSHATLEACPLDETDEGQECTVQVWEQLWLTPAYQMTDFTCKPSTALKFQPSTNGDASMDQGSSVNQIKPVLGGDDHDIGHGGMFAEFKKTFNKQYSSKTEESKRFQIFHDNMVKAKNLQSKERGTAKYGPTKFADLTEEEFKKFLGFRPELRKESTFMTKAEIPDGPIPDAFDWRDHNAVTPVKNQGSCGSCWAFSTTGDIEGQWAIKKKQLLSLSEQELVDCDKVDQGCNGGLPSNAYEEIIRMGGLETESDYPYEGADEKCTFSKQKAKVQISRYVNISSNEDHMAAWLVKNGPISIGINAMAMQFYMGGVSHPWSIFCSPSLLDHGVLIVGYGVHDGFFGKTPYWIVKNSWGPDWGEKGYYLVYRGDGTCGLNTMCTSATVN